MDLSGLLPLYGHALNAFGTSAPLESGSDMIWLSALAFLLALAFGAGILHWSRRHHLAYGDMPQRMHAGEIPRLGGVALLCSMCICIALGIASTALLGDPSSLKFGQFNFWWGVTMLPAVLGGIAEDISQRISVRYRLMLTMITGAIAVVGMGLTVPRVDVPVLDSLMIHWPWLGIALAILAITGLPHAFNIIDGCNGLASMVAVIICLALAHVALQLGDRSLAAMMLLTAAATCGFLFWNYPRGMLFAGDGGAYLWGVMIALGCIALVQRHPQVSPWFPMLLLIYPVWETLFSIYRKLARGMSPGMADALHFHQLIYRRIVWGVFDDDASRDMLMRNNRTSPYLWAFTLLTVLPAVLFWNSSLILAICIFIFIFIYISAYITIVRFKIPSWLQN